jgi:hypothetical protein
MGGKRTLAFESLRTRIVVYCQQVFTNLMMAVAALAGTSARNTPHVLTTDELRSHLIGFTVIRPDLPRGQGFSDDPEQFGANGDYVCYADNVESHGTYTIKNSQVCTRLGKQDEQCGFIILDEKAKYWFMRSLMPPNYKNISFIKTQR